MLRLARKVIVMLAITGAAVAATGCGRETQCLTCATTSDKVPPPAPAVPTTSIMVNVNFHVHSNCIGEPILGAIVSTPNASASTDSLGNTRLLLIANTTVAWSVAPPTPNPSGYNPKTGVVDVGAGDSTTPIEVTLERTCATPPTTPTPSCTYKVANSVTLPGSGAKNIGLSVVTTPLTGCPWTPTTDSPSWIHIKAISPLGINFDVDAGPPRVGKIFIADKVVTINQVP